MASNIKRTFGPPPLNTKGTTHGQHSPSLSPQSSAYPAPRISPGTMSRPAKSHANNECCPEELEKLREQQFLAHIEQIHQVNDVRPLQVTLDWILKKSEELPDEANDRIYNAMHLADTYDLLPEDDLSKMLVHKLFGNTQIRDEINTHYNVLESRVRQRVKDLSRRLVRDGYIEYADDRVSKTALFSRCWFAYNGAAGEPSHQYGDPFAGPDSDDDFSLPETSETSSSRPFKKPATTKKKSATKPKSAATTTTRKRKTNKDEENPKPAKVAKPTKSKGAYNETEPSNENTSGLVVDDVASRIDEVMAAGIEIANVVLSTNPPEIVHATSSARQTLPHLAPTTPSGSSLDLGGNRSMGSLLRTPDTMHHILQSPVSPLNAPRVWVYFQNERKHYQERIGWLTLRTTNLLHFLSQYVELTRRPLNSFDFLVFRYAHIDEDMLQKDESEARWDEIKFNMEKNARFSEICRPGAKEIEILVDVGINVSDM